MESTIFKPFNYRKFLELSTSATKIYTTTCLIFFCIICITIAEQYKQIAFQIRRLVFYSNFSTLDENLNVIQMQYSSGIHPSVQFTLY